MVTQVRKRTPKKIKKKSFSGNKTKTKKGKRRVGHRVKPGTIKNKRARITKRPTKRRITRR